MKKISLGIVALALAMTSCTDFLQEEPKLSQSNELTLSTYKGLDNSVAGAYCYLQSYAWYGAYHILNGELMAGNATNPVSLPGSGRHRTQESWSWTESSTWSNWSYAYITIAAANNVINNLEGKTSIEVTQQDINNIKAEALFLRALCHFELVNIYAQPYLGGQNEKSLGVPVVLESKIGQPKRNTVGEVYAQVVEDLTEAESLMAADYQRANVTDVYATVTKEAIQALLSRVYLYMGEWQDCADYATKVINSGKFSLYEPAQYKEMWTLNTAAKKGEIIFEVFASKKNDTWDGSGWEHLPYVTSPKGSGDVCATNDLYDLYEDGDVRKEMFVANEKDMFPTKYAGKVGSVDPKEANVPILRFAEMYLNRAEALSNGAKIDGASAINDLNAITAKRGASYAGATAGNIFTERRKELAFEGHIFFDYKRLGKSITRTDYRSTNAAYKNVEFPGKIWAMPIPKSEIEANENMEQNPY